MFKSLQIINLCQWYYKIRFGHLKESIKIEYAFLIPIDCQGVW